MKVTTVINPAAACARFAVTATLVSGADANARQISAVPRCVFVRTISTQVSPPPVTLVTLLPGVTSSAPMNASNSSFALVVENVLDAIAGIGLPTVPDPVASIASTPGGGAATVIVTAVDVVCLPDASRARADSVCDPSATAVASHASV